MTYLNGIYEDWLLKCRWFCKRLTTVDHVDHLCIKCVGNTSKNTVVKCLKTNCSFCGKAIHLLVKTIHGHRQNQLYYRISYRNTLIQQSVYLIPKMATCQMVPISLLWCKLPLLLTIIFNRLQHTHDCFYAAQQLWWFSNFIGLWIVHHHSNQGSVNGI